jgi:cytosine/uracil/thiamine/allantoin permease
VASLGATPSIGQDTPGGLDTGVFPVDYFVDRRDNQEAVNFYLPTIESEDYLFRGSWGSNCSKLVVLMCEVIPQGDIFEGQ